MAASLPCAASAATIRAPCFFPISRCCFDLEWDPAARRWEGVATVGEARHSSSVCRQNSNVAQN
jgi:hypothetical protein